jgi:hypothetical protein
MQFIQWTQETHISLDNKGNEYLEILIGKSVNLLSDKDNVTNEWYCDLNRFTCNDENMFPEKSIFSSRFSPSRNCPLDIL